MAMLRSILYYTYGYHWIVYDTLEIEEIRRLSLTFALRNDPNEFNNEIPMGIYLPEMIDVLVVCEKSLQ